MDIRVWLCFHKALEDRFHSLCPVLLNQYGSLEEAIKDPSLRKNVYFTEEEKSKVGRLDSFYEEIPPFVKVICMEDPDYPQRLKQYYLPPAIIYCIGDISLLTKNTVAVVGSRDATDYGKGLAFAFSRALSEQGYGIISGMAMGVDRYAHLGGLAGEGKTIAVLGTGPDCVYPFSNRDLYEKIIRDGLVISEYYPRTPPEKWHFPRRNRLISGLSLGTFVVEAKLRSGALITAGYAMEEGKDVWGLPGDITREQSQGVLKMIQEGAKPVMHPSDILEDLEHIIV